LYVGNTGTGTSFAFFAGDGLSQLQISNVIAVLGGNGLKYGIWSQSSITVSNCEMYITSADLNSNGVMIYNETGATASINANIQNVRVLSTGATLNNRGVVFNNNFTAETITGNVTNCNLTAYASTGVTDIALYVNSTTTNNVTVNAYNSLFDGADSDVTVIGTNSCTLSNCTLTHGTATGTVVYAGTQVVANEKLSGTLTMGDNIVQGTAAKGFNFTANTPAAGMTSQLFKWYEEGAWTPEDDSGAALTLTVYSATYTKIGRMVMLEAAIYYPSNADASAMKIKGLPFTSATGVDNTGGLCITATTVGANYYGLITRNAKVFTVNTSTDTSVLNLSYSLKVLKFFGFYHTD
jgi:hypothetical protein